MALISRNLKIETNAYLTPKEIQELVEWTKASLEEEQFHPLLIIGNFLVEFLQIHPFQDGNGRVSRILTNLLLLQSSYEYMSYVSHEKLIEDNKLQRKFGANFSFCSYDEQGYILVFNLEVPKYYFQ